MSFANWKKRVLSVRSYIAIAFISALVTVVTSSLAQAASYQQIGGAIIDPIQLTAGGPHPYAGSNLAPFASIAFADLGDAQLSSADLFTADMASANLPSTDLSSADLTNATLSGTTLSFANLTNANLTNSNLSAANLSFANLSNANLSGTNLSVAVLLSADFSLADLSSANFEGADLSFAFNLATTTWSGVAPTYDATTDFTSTGFNAYEAGWTAVPEPSMGLLITTGIVGLVLGAGRKRRTAINRSSAPDRPL